ncbi:pancreatic lipase-related protein 2-like [Coccinella septempunctata]|uniref:pancreatic lipase-related protein 2-like n=1 Tax=Coccinella septempunctata TaxID=41139 RepID=UPI001D05FF78|nr:pancreatic lipase-related protein 2-like [Coccinella septempunctata]
MQFCYFFAFFFISNISGRQLPDPLHGLENLADKVLLGADNVGQGVLETLNPVVKVVDNVDKAVLGGIDGTLNKGIFKVENGVVQGLSEVIGVPVTLQDVNFFLATSRNVRNPTKVDYAYPADVAATKAQIFFITHGWSASRKDSWVGNLTEVLLMRYPQAHVVQVDWSKPAGDEYPFAAFHTESVGEIVANLTKTLVHDHNVPPENIVLMGHSLGGQISGWAGKKFKKSTGKTLPLIVALDPAGPLFCLRPEQRRLNRYDAERVMVIHTDGGVLGFIEPCGTIDFFPNGGTEQPGCAKINVIDLASYLNPLSCDHGRSHEYLIEAINSTKAFPAKKCKSYTDFVLNLSCEDVVAHMGHLDETNEGTFFLKTASAKLFSLPLKKPEPENKDKSSTTVRNTVINLQENDRVYQVGNDIVIDVKDRKDTRPRVQGAPGDTIIYVDRGTTEKTVVQGK